MENPPSEVIDTSKFSFDLSLRKSTTNRLDYLYEISHVPEDSKIPITDFLIVNPYIVFDKPQVSFKKSIKKLLGPSQSSTIKEYVQASKFDQYNIPASEIENFITLAETGIHTPPFWSGKISINFPWKKGTPCSL